MFLFDSKSRDFIFIYFQVILKHRSFTVLKVFLVVTFSNNYDNVSLHILNERCLTFSTTQSSDKKKTVKYFIQNFPRYRNCKIIGNFADSLVFIFVNYFVKLYKKKNKNLYLLLKY